MSCHMCLLQAFFCSRQFRRCLQLLRGTELIDKDLRFRYLAARCALFTLQHCIVWYAVGPDRERPALLLPGSTATWQRSV